MALQSVWIERLNWDDAQIVLLLEARQIFAKNEVREGKIQTILEFKKQNLLVFEITLYTKSKM